MEIELKCEISECGDHFGVNAAQQLLNNGADKIVEGIRHL